MASETPARVLAGAGIIPNSRYDEAIREVQRVAVDYYRTRLTPEQARNLIDENFSLARELRDWRYELDTVGRDRVAVALVRTILDGVPLLIRDRPDMGDDYWHWPLNGSSDAYAAEFFRRYRQHAQERGYEVE